MLKIFTYPDPLLNRISEPVTNFDSNLSDLLDEMAEAMYHSEGIGLAAPQVGHQIRAFIVDIRFYDETQEELLEFINPHLSEGSGSIDFEEGCLSVPGITEFVRRKEKIKIDYQDRFGTPRTLEAEGLLSVAIQHENDHLDGVLFIDRISTLKRRLIKRKIAKSPKL